VRRGYISKDRHGGKVIGKRKQRRYISVLTGAPVPKIKNGPAELSDCALKRLKRVDPKAASKVSRALPILKGVKKTERR